MAIKGFIILLLVGALLSIDLPALIKKKKFKEIGVYSTFSLIGIVLLLSYYVFEVDFSVVTKWFIKITSKI